MFIFVDIHFHLMDVPIFTAIIISIIPIKPSTTGAAVQACI